MDCIRTINLLFLFSLSFYLVQITQVNAWGEGYEVHIVNGLPDNTNLLRVHVFSGDEERGYHDLHVNEDYYWHFKMGFFENTKYYAHFWWGTKERSFAVFDSRLAADYFGVRNENIGYWLVKADGFYVANVTSPPPDYLIKLNVWV
jgi:hypothetical protein